MKNRKAVARMKRVVKHKYRTTIISEKSIEIKEPFINFNP